MKKAIMICVLSLFALILSAAEISPRVVSTARKECKFVIKLTDQEVAAIPPDATLRGYRADRRDLHGAPVRKAADGTKLDYKLENNQIELTLPVDGESERVIEMISKADRKANPKAKAPVIFSVTFSAVNPDLFALHPFKGDFHCHSEVSDGKYTPFTVGAYSRRVGFDFLALSDHRRLAGSRAMVRDLAKYQLDYLPLPGEEFHSRPTIVHSVAVGHTKGVHEWIAENPEVYQKLVEEAKAKLKDKNLPDFEREFVANAQVLYRKARDLGAELVIFSHPEARGNFFNGPPVYTDAILELGEFDAVEVPNAHLVDSMLTYNRCVEKSREGKFYRYVGVSDSHDVALDRFGKVYTIVFSPELSLKGIADAIKTGNNVSVYNIDTPAPLIFGSRRLSQYAYFLLNNYFPKHDEICRKQGDLLLAAARGEAYDAEAMAGLNRELAEFRMGFFAE